MADSVPGVRFRLVDEKGRRSRLRKVGISRCEVDEAMRRIKGKRMMRRSVWVLGRGAIFAFDLLVGDGSMDLGGWWFW